METQIVASAVREDLNESKLIEERKKRIFEFVRIKYYWIIYLILALIVFIAVKIRSSNLSKLRDITTGGWTLGPDLDPFLFLRWTRYIVEHGSLYAVDKMRYVPLGFNTKEELLLHPYMMAWFHKIAVFFGSTSVEHSAVLYPVFFFAITIIAFFFMTRKMFLDSLGNKKASLIALLSSFYLSIIPALMPRTIAGIPEKEAAGFFFIFITFYLFLTSWKAKNEYISYALALLSGITTAMMALVWGGYIYIFIVIGLSVLIAFFFEQINKKRLILYSLWLFSSTLIILLSTHRYSLMGFLTSETTSVAFIVFGLIIVNYILFNTSLKKLFELHKLAKFPKSLICLIVFLIFAVVISSATFGVDFLPQKIWHLKNTLINPITDRLGVTVAENRQPYYNEWAISFGPILSGLPVFFWIMFIGSIFLFYNLISHFNKKDKIILTLAYFVFITALIFSRHSPTGIFNGVNFLSVAFYAMGVFVFLCTFGYYYYQYYKKGETNKFKSIDFGLIIIFTFFFFSIISARSAIRLIMVLVPSASIIASYFFVEFTSHLYENRNNDLGKIMAWILIPLIVFSALFSSYYFYRQISAQALNYAPDVYTVQWQQAMKWVRENTPKNAVFGHWWDYGYWLQSIGDRATVLDGGNAIPYWNHLMGRYALTGPDSRESLDFLYAHGTTHFLIDSTDIGKYSAFSSIGSDKDYDRASFIPTFLINNKYKHETKNSTIYLYEGGAPLDEDIIYRENGTNIFLPAGRSGLGAILIERNVNGTLISQPRGIFVSNQLKYTIPLRYAYDGGSLKDFGSGIEAGVYLMPYFYQDSSGSIAIDKKGAMLYLSRRTVNSQLARLYLYKQEDKYYTLVHSEDDFIVTQAKQQKLLTTEDIIYYNGVRGPIRIWEINYPEDIEFKEKYLDTYYPLEVKIAR